MEFYATAVILMVLLSFLPLFSDCWVQTASHEERIDLEELLTLPLSMKDSHEKNTRILPLITRVGGDKDLSYETSWSNGSRTFTVVKVRRFKRDSVKEVNFNPEILEDATLRSSAPRKEERSSNLVVQKRRVFGVDNRKQVDSTLAQNTPYSAIAQVSCGSSCTWSCTGTLISPRHVLTAAHCVYNEAVSSVRVGFLQYDSSPIWYSVKRINVPNGWLQNRKLKYDYALLTLTSSKVRRSFLNVSALRLRRSRLLLAGFHSDKPQNTLWQSRCLSIGSQADIILYKCDAYNGSSGSGILVKFRRPGQSSTYLVTGIHAGSQSFKIPTLRRRLSFNVACKLTIAKVKQIKRWTRN